MILTLTCFLTVGQNTETLGDMLLKETGHEYREGEDQTFGPNDPEAAIMKAWTLSRILNLSFEACRAISTSESGFRDTDGVGVGAPSPLDPGPLSTGNITKERQQTFHTIEKAKSNESCFLCSWLFCGQQLAIAVLSGFGLRGNHVALPLP